MRRLKCTQEDCESEIFTVNITVGPDGEVAETPHKIPGEYFICCECHSEAEWVETNG